MRSKFVVRRIDDSHVLEGMRTASCIVSLNYGSLSQLINDEILTSFCSVSWGDCGGVITCSLHTSSVIPSSSGGGNGTLARGGTSTASCVKEERQTNSELNWRGKHPNFNNAVSKTNFQNKKSDINWKLLSNRGVNNY